MSASPRLYAADPLRDEGRHDGSPAEVYRERRERFGRERDRLGARWSLFANARLVAFVLALLALGFGLVMRRDVVIAVGVVLFLLFVVLVRQHRRLGRQWRRYRELWIINDEALKRLARNWSELPLRHRVSAEADHPYAADLDIFGRASLYHLMETPRTSTGEATLASWLLAPADGETVRARQLAAVELKPMLDLRDELSMRGRMMGDPSPNPVPFLEWAEGPSLLKGKRGLLWLGRISTALLWSLVILQISGVVPYPLWIGCVLVNLLLFPLLLGPAHRSLTRAWSRSRVFAEYAGLFELLATAPFGSPALRRIQETLRTDGLAAHLQMRRLERIAGLNIPASAMLYTIIQALTLWDVNVLDLLEAWQARAGRYARRWIDALGEAEALAALAALSYDHPNWTFPEIDQEAERLSALALGHPLLPESVRVDNDVEVGPPGTFLLVTGSNMSGKSTLLRAIGVNLVLAGAGGPVCANAFRAPPVTLWTSMRVQDSLERGVSYFMAELQRLKCVVDAARQTQVLGGTRFFYLLDEILQGTNTAERQVAARRIVAHLVEMGALGAVSTHDLNLAVDGPLAATAQPVHFSETFSEGTSGPTMTFDYRLRPGIATSTNALRLMQIVGLDLSS